MPPVPAGGIRTSLSVRYGPASGQGAGYGSGFFAPGVPIHPTSPEPVRVWDFPVGSNLVWTPRATEPFSFAQLRAFSNVELVRLAIETRKDQVGRLRWKIKPTDEKAARNDSAIKARCAELQTFWKKPGYAAGRPATFSVWLRALLDDLLALDAPALELLRTRGGDVYRLDVIQGDTIKVLVDDTGRLPEAPTPAYQQIIKGRIWADLTTDDLVYQPRNLRPGHLYGYGPVEQIIVTIQTIANRQATQLAHFTSGNNPPGFLTGPEGWQPAQVKEMNEWLDAVLSGNIIQKSKTLFLPSGTKYQAFKDPPLKDDFDEWLARIVAAVFSLPPTPFIRQMNRGTAGEDQERGLEEGLEPLKLWVKEMIDGILEAEFDAVGCEFAWDESQEIDRVQQAEMDDTAVRNGTKTIDEVRDDRGDEPLPNGLGSRPMVYTGTGPVLLEQVIGDFDNPPEPPEPPPVVVAPSAQVPPAGGTPTPKPKDGEDPAATKLAKRAKAEAISTDRPKARRAIAALTRAVKPILATAADDISAQVAMKLRAFHKAADDTGNLSPDQIAQALDLSSLKPLGAASYDDLFEIAEDAQGLALAGIGVAIEGDLVDQVNARAVAYAKTRAAEMVSVDGDKSLIDSTRSMIRETISTGLENNLGADAIAEAVQASAAFSADRADLIARTEISMANAAGKLDGWQAGADLGLELQVSWQTTNDDTCCDDCAANEDASPIPFGEAFPSGDDAEPAHPNCQCVTFAETISADEPGE